MNDRDKLILAWQDAKAKLENAKTEELRLRDAAFVGAFPTLDPSTDTHTIDLGNGYKFKAKTGTSYNLSNADRDGNPTDRVAEQIESLGNEGAFLAERLFKYTPKLSVAEYKKLDMTNPTHVKIRALIDTVLTTTPAQVTLELVEPKAT